MSEMAEIMKHQRNSLLSNLATMYPGSMLGEKLYRVMISLYPDYDRRRCFKDLYYLEEKGYAARKTPSGKPDTDKRTPWSEANWHATARGNELAYELITDPAMEV